MIALQERTNITTIYDTPAINELVFRGFRGPED